MVLRPLSVIAATAVFCLSGTSFAQITKQGNAYLFRIKFVKNGTIKYKTFVSNTLAEGQKPIQVVFPVNQIVVGVHNGIGDLVVKSGPMSFNGKAVTPESTYRMQVDRLGSIVGGQKASNSGITVFPDKPIRPGATWNAYVPIGGAALGSDGSKGALVKTLYKFVLMSTYKGQPVAELSLTFNSKGSTSVQGAGTALVLTKDGTIVHSTMKMSIGLSGMTPMTMNVEVTRT